MTLDQSFWDLRAPTGLQAPLPDRVASVCAYGFQVGLAPTETIEHAIRDSDLLVAMPCDIIMWTTDGISVSQCGKLDNSPGTKTQAGRWSAFPSSWLALERLAPAKLVDANPS